jgi:hypothetical protein
MQRVSQFVAFALALLMLAPAAAFVPVCNAQTEEQACSKPCCDGMNGMAMPMTDRAMPVGNQAQLSPSACCVVTETDLAQPSKLAAGDKVELGAVAHGTVDLFATALPVERSFAREFPPRSVLRAPTPSRLCTFLI